jgi:uncharacterized protein (TIRG00374 family)
MKPDYSFQLCRRIWSKVAGQFGSRPNQKPHRGCCVQLLWSCRSAFVALRDAPFHEIGHSNEVASLAACFALVHQRGVIVFMTMRWWLILRAEMPGLPFLPMIGYRLSVFAMSYFTLGPQVGGEPLQIILVRRNHHVSFARAGSAVLLDKLFEFLGNFVFIGIGLFAISQVGLLSKNINIPLLGWFVLAILVSWPVIHFILLYSRRKPISALVRTLLSKYADSKWYRLITASEYLAASFIHRHPRFLFAALLASLISWCGMAVEYLLMLQFLDIHLTIWQALASLTAALLAFLIPLPGGLGALEASQVLVLGSFGYSPAIAVGLALLMRARDMVNGLLGLWLAGGNFRKYF